MAIDLELNYKNNLEYLYNNWRNLYNDVESANIDNFRLINADTDNINISINENILYPNKK